MLQRGFAPILIVIIIATAVLGSGYLILRTKITQQEEQLFNGGNAPSENQAGCTQDAKLCPDGTYVSRTGPNCEFSPCPIHESTSSATQTHDLDLIKMACAKTTKDDISKIVLTISENKKYTGQFATGSYGVQGEAGGGIYLASKMGNYWVCPFIGNGNALCSEIDPYKFPTDLMENCIDKNGVLINRTTLQPFK